MTSAKQADDGRQGKGDFDFEERCRMLSFASPAEIQKRNEETQKLNARSISSHKKIKSYDPEAYKPREPLQLKKAQDIPLSRKLTSFQKPVTGTIPRSRTIDPEKVTWVPAPSAYL